MIRQLNEQLLLVMDTPYAEKYLSQSLSFSSQCTSALRDAVGTYRGAINQHRMRLIDRLTAYHVESFSHSFNLGLIILMLQMQIVMNK